MFHALHTQREPRLLDVDSVRVGVISTLQLDTVQRQTAHEGMDNVRPVRWEAQCEDQSFRFSKLLHGKLTANSNPPCVELCLCDLHRKTGMVAPHGVAARADRHHNISPQKQKGRDPSRPFELLTFDFELLPIPPCGTGATKLFDD
jgi:hypothetical protein